MIVEPVCDKTGGKHGSYRRVGMALIGNEKWLEAAQQQDIAIV
jgi:hypothetical protein